MLPLKNCYGKNGTYQKRRFLCLFPPQSAVDFYDVLLAGVIAGHGAVNGVFRLDHIVFGLQNRKL